MTTKMSFDEFNEENSTAVMGDAHLLHEMYMNYMSNQVTVDGKPF